MIWIAFLSSMLLTCSVSAQQPDSLVHFFALPLDTTIAREAPAIEMHDSTGIIIVDVAYGKGELSEPHRMHYVRFLIGKFVTSEYVVTEFAGNRVFAFIPDSADVFPGFRYALRGMRVGGRRRAIIPPEYAYGSRGRPSYGIGPNETLFLDLELLKLDP
ncbi:MAG: FKBP-type peptidyl-prolyl cis-trans isomerase [Chlorobi bacterium]|nr:FKBP-type peptidyl-prolyl cis-trans isomerase [Chlorobiota bacterium]